MDWHRLNDLRDELGVLRGFLFDALSNPTVFASGRFVRMQKHEQFDRALQVLKGLESQLFELQRSVRFCRA